VADTWHVSDYSLFGEGFPLGGTTGCGCSPRLSKQTTVASHTIWPQFTMQGLSGGCESSVWSKRWS